MRASEKKLGEKNYYVTAEVSNNSIHIHSQMHSLMALIKIIFNQVDIVDISKTHCI